MKVLNIRAFVPSGPDYAKSKQFFQDLGFNMVFAQPDFACFEKDGHEFFLQNYNQPGFTHHYMMAVGIDNAEACSNEIIEKKLPEKYGIRVWPIIDQPYGKEVNIADVAGCLWHFVEPPAK
jgi:hypothetical protein